LVFKDSRSLKSDKLNQNIKSYYGAGGLQVERLVRSLCLGALLGDHGQKDSTSTSEDVEAYVLYIGGMLVALGVFTDITCAVGFLMFDAEEKRSAASLVEYSVAKDADDKDCVYANFKDTLKSSTMSRKVIGFFCFKAMQQVCN
jgi:hypothetical protein